jgi:hypothetical protein
MQPCTGALKPARDAGQSSLGRGRSDMRSEQGQGRRRRAGRQTEEDLAKSLAACPARIRGTRYWRDIS